MNKTVTVCDIDTRLSRVHVLFESTAPVILSQHATQEFKEIGIPRVFNAVRTLLWALKTPEK